MDQKTIDMSITEALKNLQNQIANMRGETLGSIATSIGNPLEVTTKNIAEIEHRFRRIPYKEVFPPPWDEIQADVVCELVPENRIHVTHKGIISIYSAKEYTDTKHRARTVVTVASSSIDLTRSWLTVRREIIAGIGEITLLIKRNPSILVDGIVDLVTPLFIQYENYPDKTNVYLGLECGAITGTELWGVVNNT